VRFQSQNIEGEQRSKILNAKKPRQPSANMCPLQFDTRMYSIWRRGKKEEEMNVCEEDIMAE